MIFLIYGEDPFEMTTKLLDSLQIGITLSSEFNIVLKPNLVVPREAREGATTHPQIVEAVIQYLQKWGCYNITIAESSWIGAKTEEAFKVHKYDKLASTYNVKLLDLKKDAYITTKIENLSVELSKTVAECDYLINLPVLKGHCQTKITCALKNMKGVISDRSKRNFHKWGLHKPIALLNTLKRSDLVIVDSICGDLDFEEGGNPVQTNRMFACTDALLTDAFGANLLGYESDEIGYITYAKELNIGSTELSEENIVVLNEDSSSKEHLPSRKVKEFERYVTASSACSACYGNLIHALSRLEEQSLLNRLPKTLYIGQDYKNVKSDGVGVGSCTSLFNQFVKGCPPSAVEIVRFLKSLQ